MAKFRTILLIFVRWRERRAWAATKRWQRAGWRLHGMRSGAPIRDGVAGTFDEPPPGFRNFPPGPDNQFESIARPMVDNIRKAGGA